VEGSLYQVVLTGFPFINFQIKMKQESLLKFLQENATEIRTFANKMLPTFREAYKENNIQGVVEFAHNYIDNINEKSGLNKKLSCSAGCSFCCYSEIMMTHNEASLIYSFIEQFDIPFDRKLVTRQNAKKFHRLKYADKRCAMLNENDKCSIYQHRPSICRLYNATTDPKDCDGSAGAPNTKTLRTIQGFGVAAALITFDEEQKNDGDYPLHKILKHIMS